jgi:5-formyltetrahydrofolate cyclo-ligase
MAPTYFCRFPGSVLQRPLRLRTSLMTDPPQTEITKAQLRAEALARREALPAQQRLAAAQTIAARDFPVKVTAGMIVSGFSPMKSEINPVPLLRKLADAGAQLALPVIVKRGQPLIMRAWKFGDPFKAGQWGIREPVAEAPEVAPDILIVPLAAFDRHGHRIGFGAGYYDMTINALRAKKQVTAIGITFAAQEIPRVPATERDARLDLVLTEREVIDFRKS